MTPFDPILRYDNNQVYCVLDFETEGLNLINSKPFQASWVICRGDSVVEEYDYYMYWEDLRMSEDAARITRFDWAHYKKNAINPHDVLRKLSQVIGNEDVVIVGQNILGFDVYILNILQRLCGEKVWFPIQRCLDTKILSIAAQKNLSCDKGIDMATWQYKVSSAWERGIKCSQAFLLKNYQIAHDPSMLHNSLYDVKMTYKIFRKLLWEKSLEIPQRFWETK